jgi:hypothetical protein
LGAVLKKASAVTAWASAAAALLANPISRLRLEAVLKQARCRAEARRVQSMVKIKPASSPRAANRHPAEARCRAEARRVQSMVKMKQVW